MSFQTPGGHDAKRRRIEAANATLRKPFRSPLVNRQPQDNKPGPDGAQQNSPSINRDSAAPDKATPHTPAPARGSRHAPAAASPLSTSPSLASWSPQPRKQTTTTTTTGTASLTPLPTRRSLPRKNQITPQPQQPRSGTTTTTTTTTQPNPNTNPNPKAGYRAAEEEDGEGEEEEQDLLTRLTASQRTLHSHLRTTQSRLALVRQAAQIERASTSAAAAAAADRSPGEPVGVELTELIDRWKGASRLAAEEVFELITGRVEGMGGVRVWSRERRRAQREFYAGSFDEGLVRKEEGEGDGEDGDGEWAGEGEWERKERDREKVEEEEEGEELVSWSWECGVVVEPC